MRRLWQPQTVASGDEEGSAKQARRLGIINSGVEGPPGSQVWWVRSLALYGYLAQAEPFRDNKPDILAVDGNASSSSPTLKICGRLVASLAYYVISTLAQACATLAFR